MAIATLIDPKDLKKQTLPGFGGWFALAEQNGYDENSIALTIAERTRSFEQSVNWRLQTYQVYGAPDGTYDTTTQYPTVRESGYHFYADGMFLLHISLWKRPVQQVQRLRFLLNGIQLVFTAPQEWLLCDHDSGRFQLSPLITAGNYAAAGAALYALGVNFQGASVIPQLIYVDYLAGLTATEWASDEYYDVRRYLREWCAIGVLEEIAHLKNAGRDTVQVSVDGGSQTLNWNRFLPRIDQLQKSCDRFMPMFKQQKTPIQLDMIGGF